MDALALLMPTAFANCAEAQPGIAKHAPGTVRRAVSMIFCFVSVAVNHLGPHLPDDR